MSNFDTLNDRAYVKLCNSKAKDFVKVLNDNSVTEDTSFDLKENNSNDNNAIQISSDGSNTPISRNSNFISQPHSIDTNNLQTKVIKSMLYKPEPINQVILKSNNGTIDKFAGSCEELDFTMTNKE